MLHTHQRFNRAILVMVASVSFYLPTSFAESTKNITKSIQTAPIALSQFIQATYLSHPRLSASKAVLEAAQFQYSSAQNAIYNPELELDTEETNIRTSTIGLSQTIDWGDQQGAKTQIANQQLKAATAMFQQERQQLLRDLLLALADYKNKVQLASLSKQRLKLMKDFFDVAKQKYSAGDLNQVELDLAQLAYSESIFDNARVLASYAEAEQAFFALYGSSVNSSTALPKMAIDFQKITLPSELDKFLMALPQMQRVRAKVAASKQTINLREGQSSADPTIAIRGGKEEEESLVGITLSIPLNIRNNYRADIDVARKQYLQAEQLAQQQWRNLRRDIVSQTEHYQLTRNAWQQWKSNGQISINRQLKLLKRLWKTGDLSTTDYLVQIKQNLDTQSAGIELQTTLWGSWLTWLDSTAQIESWLQLNTTRNQ